MAGVIEGFALALSVDLAPVLIAVHHHGIGVLGYRGGHAQIRKLVCVTG